MKWDLIPKGNIYIFHMFNVRILQEPDLSSPKMPVN